MQITIDMDAGTPVFEQLVLQLKDLVQRGALTPGDPLPSIRQLAGDLGVNNKTVAKAYRLLERDRVIVTRGYRGTFIHDEAPANATVDLKARVHDALAATVAQLRAEGATDSEIRIAFGDLMRAR